MNRLLRARLVCINIGFVWNDRLESLSYTAGILA